MGTGSKAGLGWKVTHGEVLVVKTPEWTDDFGIKHPPELVPEKGFKANLRQDKARCSGSCPTSIRLSTTATRSGSSTR